MLVGRGKDKTVVGEKPLPFVCTSHGDSSRYQVFQPLENKTLSQALPPTLALTRCLSSVYLLSVCLCLSVRLSQGLFDKLFSKLFVIPALPPFGIKYLASVTSENSNGMLASPEGFSSASSLEGKK